MATLNTWICLDFAVSYAEFTPGSGEVRLTAIITLFYSREAVSCFRHEEVVCNLGQHVA